MQGQINPKIVGATVIGFALIAGAYTISHFGEPRYDSQPANVQSAISTQRVAIEIVDNDQNGIEDWRDAFVTTKSVILDQASSTYNPPDTLTGKMGIDFMQNIIRARGYGPFGSSDEEIIERTVDVLGNETTTSFYDTPDITIMEEWNDQDVVNYANTVAATITRYNNPDLKGELEILHDIVTNENYDRISELESLADIYLNYREDTLKIPVPALLIKEHLDLINTYNAIYVDIDAMTKTSDDPVVALLRLKRYEDDATGLAYALQNIYFALEDYADLFTEKDPAVLFIIFSPNYQI